MVVCPKKQQQCLPGELEVGDCWIGLSLANPSGLILAARVGKHTDKLIAELVVTTKGKTDGKHWHSDDWGGYERVLPPEILHHIGQDKTQRCSYEPMALLDNKPEDATDGKISLVRCGSYSLVTTRLVVSYFNWIWQHSRFKTTAGQRAKLATQPWTWQALLTYPTII